jgi:PAS domain S-box-containing protein
MEQPTLRTELERQEEALALLIRASMKGMPVPELYQLAVEVVGMGTDERLRALAEVKPDGSGLVLCAQSEECPRLVGEQLEPSSFAAYIQRTRLTARVSDLFGDKRFHVNRSLREFGIVSAMGAPMCDGERSLGVLLVYATEVRVFSDNEARFLSRVANLLALAVSRHRLEEEVAGAAQLYRRLMDATQDAIVLLAPDGRVEACNRAACEVFGRAEDEMEGLAVGVLLPTLVLGLHGASDLLEVEGRRADGGAVPLEIRVSGGPLITLVARDISERKRTTRMMEEQRAQLLHAQKMEAMGCLAGGMAHDFNNMLCVINGYAEVLLSTLPADASGRDELQEIHKAGERAAGLTRQLLVFSRRQQMQPRDVLPETVLGDLVKMLKRLVGEDVNLEFEASEADAAIHVDPLQFEQAVVNLVVNARDAMPRGGSITLSLSTVEVREARAVSSGVMAAGSWVELAVLDTGCGMEPEVLARVFEPFFTTKEAGRGTGLGLSTVYGFVQQSGGHLQVESWPGIGSMFRLYFPARGVAGEGVAAPRVELASGSGTVLVVEDDAGVCAIVAHCLREAGYQVVQARGGRAAVEAARLHRGRIDVILADLILPDADGLALSEELLAVAPGARVVFMSGHAPESLLRHGVDESKVRFLRKPFRRHELLGCVVGARARAG